MYTDARAHNSHISMLYCRTLTQISEQFLIEVYEYRSNKRKQMNFLMKFLHTIYLIGM